MSRFRIVVLILACGLLATLGLLFILVQQPALTTAAAQRILSRLEQELQAEVRIGRLALEPLQGRVTLHQLRIFTADAPQVPLLEVERVLIRLSRTALLRREVRVAQLDVVNPIARGRHLGKNRYNWDVLLAPQAAPAQPSQPARLILDRLNVTGGRITYEDHERRSSAEIAPISADLWLDARRQVAGGRLTAHAGWLTLEQQTWPLNRAHVRFSQTGPRITLSEVEIKPQGIVVSARGQLTASGPAPTLQVDGRLQASLAQLPAWKEWRARGLGGTLWADWGLRGTPAEPIVALELKAHALQADRARIDSAHIKARATPHVIQLEHAKVKVAEGSVQLRGALPLATGQNGHLNFQAAGLSIPHLLDAAEVSRPPGLSSRFDATLALKGRGQQLADWQGGGGFKIQGYMRQGAASMPFELTSQVQLAGRRIQLNALHARALGGQLTARLQANIPSQGSPGVQAEGQLSSLQLAQVAPFLTSPLPVTGTLGGQFQLSGQDTPDSWRGSGDVQFRGEVSAETLGSAKPAPLQLTTGWRLQNHILQLSSTQGILLGGKLGFQAQVPLENPARGVRAELQLRTMSVPEASRVFANRMPILNGTLDVAARLRGEQLTLDQLDVRIFEGRLSTRGAVTLSTPAQYRFDTRIERLNLGSLQRSLNPHGLPLTGLANASLKLAGRGAEYHLNGPLQASGHASMPHPDIPGAQIKLPLEIIARLNATPQAVNVEQLHIQMADLIAKATGSYRARGQSNLAFTLKAEQLDRVGRMAGNALLSGDRLQISGSARGPASALQLDAKLSADRLAYGTTSLQGLRGSLSGLLNDKVKLAGRLAGQRTDAGGVVVDTWHVPFAYEAPAQRPGQGRLRVPAFLAQLAQGRLEGHFDYGVSERNVSLALNSHNLTLGDVVPVAKTAALPRNTAVTVQATARGPVSALVGDLRVKLGGFLHQGHAFGPSEFTLQSQNERLELKGRLFGDQAVLAGQLASRRGDVQMQLRAPGFRLAPLLAAVPDRWRGTTELPSDGFIAGEINLKGNIHQPKTARGRIELGQFRLEYPELSLRNEGPWRLSLSNQGLTFDTFKLRGAATQLDVRGTLGLESASDLGLEGALDLRTLEKLAPAQFAGASGRLKIDGLLRGRWDDDSLTGAFNIRDGELETRNLPQPVRDLNVALRVTPRQVFLDSLQASFGQTGRLQATGGARLNTRGAPIAANLQLDAQEMALRVPGFEAVANADLSYVWQPGKGSLDGQIRVLEGAYTEDVDLTRKLTTRRVARSSSSSALANPFVKDTALRIQLALPDQFFVRNNVVKGEIRGDVLLLGTPANPALVGRVEARDTQVTFQDRIYTLDAGTVDFIDPLRLVPYVNLSARSTIQAVDVRVQANGTPDKLRLELTSTPAMSQTDILTLIATGKTSKELGESGSGGLATASNFLLDQVAGGVARGITDQGVVDVVKVKPGSVDPASPGGASFTVGKRINEKLTITYTQDITAPAGQTPGRIMIFDYLLTDAVVLKLEQDLGGGFNASARYRLPIR